MVNKKTCKIQLLNSNRYAITFLPPVGSPRDPCQHSAAGHSRVLMHSAKQPRAAPTPRACASDFLCRCGRPNFISVLFRTPSNRRT